MRTATARCGHMDRLRGDCWSTGPRPRRKDCHKAQTITPYKSSFDVLDILFVRATISNEIGFPQNTFSFAHPRTRVLAFKIMLVIQY